MPAHNFQRAVTFDCPCFLPRVLQESAQPPRHFPRCCHCWSGSAPTSSATATATTTATTTFTSFQGRTVRSPLHPFFASGVLCLASLLQLCFASSLPRVCIASLPLLQTRFASFFDDASSRVVNTLCIRTASSFLKELVDRFNAALFVLVFLLLMAAHASQITQCQRGKKVARKRFISMSCNCVVDRLRF